MSRCIIAGLLFVCSLAASPALAAPPAGPTALVGTAPSPGAIALSWSPAPNASSYSVYRDYYDVTVWVPPLGYFVISSNAVKVGTVTGTSFTDAGVSNLVR